MKGAATALFHARGSERSPKVIWPIDGRSEIRTQASWLQRLLFIFTILWFGPISGLLFSAYLFSPGSGLPTPDTAPAPFLSFTTRQLPGVEALGPMCSLCMILMQAMFTQAQLGGDVCAPLLSLSTCDLKSSHQRTQDLDAHVTFVVSWLCNLRQVILGLWPSVSSSIS